MSPQTTKAQHAPGPWAVASYRDNPARLSLTIVDADGNEVATVQGWAAERDNGEATARLIAAAPDMYELLRQFLGGEWQPVAAACALLARIDGGAR